MTTDNPNFKDSLNQGISFGLTSAVITTLGLMIGLNSSTGSRSVVIGGILTIAIADAFSDALGIHIAEESENRHTEKEIWASTIFTFLAKFIFALTFLIPVAIFSLSLALIVSVIWGFLLLTILSCRIAKNQNEKWYKIVFEHLFIATVVIVTSNAAGKWITRL